MHDPDLDLVRQHICASPNMSLTIENTRSHANLLGVFLRYSVRSDATEGGVCVTVGPKLRSKYEYFVCNDRPPNQPKFRRAFREIRDRPNFETQCAKLWTTPTQEPVYLQWSHREAVHTGGLSKLLSKAS